MYTIETPPSWIREEVIIIREGGYGEPEIDLCTYIPI